MLSIQVNIYMEWMSQDLVDCKSTLLRVMSLPEPVSPYGVARHNELKIVLRPEYFDRNLFAFDVLLTMPWWRHQMETFSALLALIVARSPAAMV